MLQGVEGRKRSLRADYITGSREQGALIAGGDVIGGEQSIDLRVRAMAEVVVSV